MLVNLRTLSNTSFTEHFDPTDTIASVKQTMSEKHGFDVESMRLVFKGKTLTNEKSLAECGVDGTGFIIILVSKLAIRAKQAPQPVDQSPVHEEEEKPVLASPVETLVPETPVLQTEALPMFVIEEAKYDPPDFEAKLAPLLQMGFLRPECEEALRAAAYDPELAASYILEGIPNMPRLRNIVEAQADDEEEDGDVADATEKVRAVVDKVRAGEVAYDEMQRYLQAYFPAHAYVLRHNPIGFFVDLGFDPTEFQQNIGRKSAGTVYERLMSEFSEQEKSIIHRLEEKGFDTMMVIQVFNACQKNEVATLECLKSIGQ